MAGLEMAGDICGYGSQYFIIPGIPHACITHGDVEPRVYGCSDEDKCTMAEKVSQQWQ